MMIKLDMLNKNFIKSLILTYKYKKRFIIHPKVKIFIDKRAKVDIGGTIDLGKRWSKSAFRATSFLVEKNGTFKTEGYIDCLTGTYIKVAERASLVIGSGSINQNTNIQCYNSITIGNNVGISENVVIRDSDNHRIIGKEMNHVKTKPIVIGNHVWIGMNVIILKGVHIGDNAVIGAGSVVTHDIPSDCLAVGNPARVIRRNITWDWE